MWYSVIDMKRTAVRPQALVRMANVPTVSRDASLDAVSIDFGSGPGPVKLSGLYKKQQTSFDVHQIRYYMQEDGYGYKITDLMGNYIVGPQGITVDFNDDYLNCAWRSHEWNPEQPEEGFAEVQRFLIMALARDGESILQISADKQDFYITPIDILDLPLNSKRTVTGGLGTNIGFVAAAYSGIDRDRMRRPLRYNFWPQIGTPYILPADQVVHTYVRKFAGQERGLSWFLGALDTMKELSEFEHNVARAVRIAASDPGHYSVPKRLFPSIEPDSASTVEKAEEMLNTMVNRDPSKRGVHPEDIKFIPTDVGNIFQGTVAESYRKAALSRIAACVGMAYYSVSGDLSQANFSALQQGNLDNRALYRKTQDKILAAVKRIVRRWLYWQGLRSERMESRIKNIEPTYLIPPFEYIDRAKAVQADEKLFQIKATSRSQIIRAMGQDPWAIFKQVAEDEFLLRKAYEEYGLEYPEDKVPNPDLTDPAEDDTIEDGKEDDEDKEDK